MELLFVTYLFLVFVVRSILKEAKCPFYEERVPYQYGNKLFEKSRAIDQEDRPLFEKKV